MLPTADQLALTMAEDVEVGRTWAQPRPKQHSFALKGNKTVNGTKKSHTGSERNLCLRM